MRYRVWGTPEGGKEMAFVVVADTIEEARHKARLDRIAVREVSPIDETAERGERWFVGATVTALLVDSVIGLFVVAVALGGGGEGTAWARKTSWQAGAPVVLVIGTTLLLTQAAYAGARWGRRLDLIWAVLQLLVTLPVVVSLVVGLVGAAVRKEGALPWGVMLVVPLLRLGAYVFLGWVLWLSRSARAFLDGQGRKSVQLVTFGFVALLVVVIAALLVTATIPFTGF
jgi:hypothetical protein